MKGTIPTIGILGNQWLGLERLTGETGRVLRPHPELVLSPLVQLGGIDLRLLAEPGDLCPVVVADFALLDQVVEDFATAIVFGWLPLKVAVIGVDVGDLDGSAWWAWAS